LRLQRSDEEAPHRLALPAIEVVAVVLAQRLDEEVEVVRLRGADAPREVRPTPDEHERKTREDRSPDCEAGAGELREEISDLRARDEERMARLGALRSDEKRIRRRGRSLERRSREAAVVDDDTPR
jgi:predicted RNase H-like nuclease (RuvC/YqgF family)